MKKYIYRVLIAVTVAISIYACKESQIDDLNLPAVAKQSITGEGIVVGNVTLDNQFVKVPFKISLSGAAQEAFQVGLTLNNDTVTQLINNGTLTNAILMPSAVVEYPNVINVAYGSTNAEGIAVVRRSFLERNLSKKVAFALKLSQPGKGNNIASGKSTILVIINTSDLLKESDVHYLAFANSGTLNVASGSNYTVTPNGILIPLSVNLTNPPSTAFTINVRDNIDTIATLVANNTLSANTIHLKANEFSIDTLIRFGTGVSTAVVRINIPWAVFDANIVANKKFAFAINLTKNTNHVIDPVKSKVLVVIDPNVNLDNNSFITGNGTGLRARYYRDNQQADFDGRAPTSERIDGTIAFANGDAWPDGAKVSRDNFSVRWKGEFLAPVRGEYIFYQTRWDDGSRLYINGKAIIDDYTTSWDQPGRNAKITLQRGVRYTIELHHRENVGGQQAFFEYEVPSAGLLGRRIVPQSQLFPATQ